MPRRGGPPPSPPLALTRRLPAAWPLAALLATALCGCAHGASAVDDQAQAEFARCAQPGAATPPPGSYLDQGLQLDYERLDRRPEAWRQVDTDYLRSTVADPRRLEQLYFDATHGNARAVKVICLMEAGARSGGRAAAHQLAALACRSTALCGVRYDPLPFSGATASGRRTLMQVGAAFEGEAARLGVQLEVAARALSLLVGVEMAARLGRAPLVAKPAPRPVEKGPLLAPRRVDKAPRRLDEKELGEVRGPGPARSLALGEVEGAGPVRRFKSFEAFKNAMGPAGPDKQWHHIVEQNPTNMKRFRPEQLHNTSNVIRIDKPIHDRISWYYSSKDRQISTQLTVRQWVSMQSFEAQRAFGIKLLRRFGVIP